VEKMAIMASPSTGIHRTPTAFHTRVSKAHVNVQVGGYKGERHGVGGIMERGFVQSRSGGSPITNTTPRRSTRLARKRLTKDGDTNSDETTTAKIRKVNLEHVDAKQANVDAKGVPVTRQMLGQQTAALRAAIRCESCRRFNEPVDA